MTGPEEGSFEEMWCKYEGLVFKYAPLETKKSVKRLMKQYLSVENSDKGDLYVCRCMLMIFAYMCVFFIQTERTTAYVIDLLTAYVLGHEQDEWATSPIHFRGKFFIHVRSM